MNPFKTRDTDLCPFFREPCLKERCHMWQPETMLKTDNATQARTVETRYDCEIHWIKVMLKETAQQQRETGAAIESMRNESVTNARTVAAGMAAGIGQVLESRLQEKQKWLED